MMKKIFLLAAISLLGTTPALTQTTPFSTYVLGLAAVGSLTGAEKMVAVSGGVPKTLTPNQILSFVSGDCTIASPPSIVCTKTNGVNFVASATTDTTSASNISSGTLALPRLALTSAFFYVGNGSNNPAGVAMSGDCTLANTGAVTCLKAGGVTLAASATTDTTVATNIGTGTLANARYAAVNLAVGNVNGGVTGALPFTNLPTGSLDTNLGFWGSTTMSAVSMPNCTAGALQYATSTHTFNCNVGAGAGTVTSITAGTGLSGGTITGVGTIALTAARQTLPTIQRFTSGSAATYNTPANVLWVRIRLVGGAGGGSGGGNTGGGDSSVGSASTFSGGTLSAGGGGAAIGAGGTATGGAGGAASGGNVFNIPGGAGGGGGIPGTGSNGAGGIGGSSCLGGAGQPVGGAAGQNGAVNSGAGGAGGGAGNSVFTGGGGSGGGSGGCVEHIIQSPASTYTYTVGGGGGGGAAGTGGGAGGAGASGIIIVEEHYGS